MFKGIGILLIIYTIYSAYAGEVYAKKGPGGQMYYRKESPRYFWTIISIYTLLSMALIFIF